MEGENIVCFAKDWTEDPTSNNHVMKMLSRDNRVLWLNSIATRTPTLTSGRDLGKIGRKLARFAKGLEAVGPARPPAPAGAREGGGLWIHTPIVLPLPHSRIAQGINEQILRTSLGALRRKLGMADFQLWTFLPTAVRYVGKMGEALSVYYCTDEWSQFSHVDAGRITEMEADLCRRVDLVFATSRTLVERKRIYNAETHLASHGVDQAHFAAALAPGTTVPEDIAGLAGKGPIVGFFGLIEDWIDLDCFAHVAANRPDWTVVIIGKANVDVSRLAAYPNIKLLGRKPYAELPRYCKAFSVGLMPFALNELTRNVNPIKMREYLSAGLPVVSTNLPEVAAVPEWCAIAHDQEGFLAACDEAIRTDSPGRRLQRSEAMKRETWEEKVKELGVHVMRVKARKAAKAGAA